MYISVNVLLVSSIGVWTAQVINLYNKPTLLSCFIHCKSAI